MRVYMVGRSRIRQVGENFVKMDGGVALAIAAAIVIDASSTRRRPLFEP